VNPRADPPATAGAPARTLHTALGVAPVVVPPRRAGVPAAIKEQWSQRYRDTPYQDLPWFSAKPYPCVTRAVEEKWWIRGSRILDIGCGAGTNSLYLAKAGFRVTGIDLAEGAIDAARTRAADAGLRVDFRVADALNLPFPEAHFGGAIDIGCFHAIPVELRRRYSKEVGRVVHPRRAFVLSWVAREHRTDFGPPHRPSLEEAAAALEEEFLFRRTEFQPSSTGRQFKGAMPVYFALLGRRSFPRPATR
jgi:SAM-dependent methyltransferase